MSLDVTLTAVRVTDIFTSNITHNLNTMAQEAGIYKHLWRPEEIGIKAAGELIKPLRQGLARLEAEPERFKLYEPENRWGTYDGFVGWVSEYLEACEENPDAMVSVSR